MNIRIPVAKQGIVQELQNFRQLLIVTMAFYVKASISGDSLSVPLLPRRRF